MSSRYRVVIPSNTAHLAKRLAQPFSKRKLLHAARMMGPTLTARAVPNPQFLHREDASPDRVGGA